jgi:hypothetical protein
LTRIFSGQVLICVIASGSVGDAIAVSKTAPLALACRGGALV